MGRGGRLGEGPGAEHQPDCAGGRTSRSLLTEQGGQLRKPQHQGSGLHGAAPLHLLHESNCEPDLARCFLGKWISFGKLKTPPELPLFPGSSIFSQI